MSQHHWHGGIFASLRGHKGWDKETLYEELGVESLSSESGVTEAIGQKALRLIKGESEREQEPIEPRSFVDLLADADLERMAASQPDGERVFDPVVQRARVAPPVPLRRGRPGLTPRQPAAARLDPTKLYVSEVPFPTGGLGGAGVGALVGAARREQERVDPVVAMALRIFPGAKVTRVA